VRDEERKCEIANRTVSAANLQKEKQIASLKTNRKTAPNPALNYLHYKPAAERSSSPQRPLLGTRLETLAPPLDTIPSSGHAI